ncbi:MAG TPA: ATP-dependent RNA helicase, partial [Chitinophagaceae bacterium]|nr:ATP-dependent RNA helicase [Chitinophagaceae bacterium]
MHTFETLGLNAQLVKSVTQLGFTTPTPIQEKAIPVLLQGTKDFIGLAQTGTGKTAAFGLPLLQLVDPQFRQPSALIICPTRELCLQITGDLKKFQQGNETVQVTAVYGGASIVGQIKDLKRGTQVVVATPGRLIDLIERRAINLENIEYVVLDEADRMLDIGFLPDLQRILSYLPKQRTTLLFSATFSPEI